MENSKTNTASLNPENPCGTSVCGGGGNLLINKTKRPFRAKAHKFFEAFTLSEVLVTLTILGIVASIVVPNLMQQYKKAQTISRLKIAYSMLSDMVKQSYIENGYPELEFGTNNFAKPENFYTYFGKYLNIAKDCGINSDDSELSSEKTGCFKAGSYKDINGNEKLNADGSVSKIDTFVNLDGKQVTAGGYGPSRYYKVLLKNGMSLGINGVISRTHGIAIVVDIDGPNKGQSRLGQDVFEFVYMNGLGFCKTVDLFPGYHIEKASCTLSREELIKGCKINGEGVTGYKALYPNGSGCSGLIIKDGWKISKDYPWDYAQKKIK